MIELDPTETLEGLISFQKLDRDLQRAATALTTSEARILVDAYYAVQGYRIRFGNQIRAQAEAEEPHELLRWMHSNTSGLEKNIQKALNAYSLSDPIGQWMRQVPGIGPVIASGFLAHVDITKAPYAGHLLTYAGLNPERHWTKGEKRPWNADLKKLAVFLLGESFIKVQNNPRDIYGKIYARRKQVEKEANELGMFAEAAAKALAEKNYRGDTVAKQYYTQGKLPPAHIHARARRFAVKIFLSHLWEVWYEHHYQVEASRPYVIEFLNHQSYIPPPYWPLSRDPKVAHEEEIIDLSIFDTPEEDLDEETMEPLEFPTLALKLARFKAAVAAKKARHEAGIEMIEDVRRSNLNGGGY